MTRTLAGAYDDTPTDRQERKDASRARTFHTSPQMERLAALRDTDPKKYDALPASVQMALGYYANDKAAAERATTTQES